jgi:hypothetical protein
VTILQQRAKSDYLNLRAQGRSDKDIQAMFKDDPFIKLAPIVKQIKMMDKAREEKDDLAMRKAIH